MHTSSKPHTTADARFYMLNLKAKITPVTTEFFFFLCLFF